ncbi:zinc finger Y-chromosomal protein 1-like [Anoplophora glabripennis]|uniref:zinc finger Y-chromosomal protein 1-like n=1 Tax=Anoplophora glabripennis TaxID=217634 RepID=UPI0008743D5B|nr:zinc finger Y-chromosomal protein 1-like [Anoplophora glabripennis]
MFDLRDTYMKEMNSEQLMGISNDQKVCRFCKQTVKNEFRCIREEEVAVIQKFLPEMNMAIVKDPVVCKPCCDFAYAHNSVLKDCLKVKVETENIPDSTAADIKIDTSMDFLSETDNLDKATEINYIEMSIKNECIDIKSEEDEDKSDMFVSNSNEAENDTYQITYISKHKKGSKSYKCYMEIGQQINLKVYRIKMHACDKCDYKTVCKSHFNEHCTTHKNGSEVNGHYICEYENINRKFFLKHQLRFGFKTQMYPCNVCDYETNSKSSFNLHYVKHTQLSELKVHTHKNNMEIPSHQLQHSNLPYAQIFQCYICSFKTQYKTILEQHMLEHVVPTPAQMYKFDSCNYETQHKSDFERHLLEHRTPTQGQMYKSRSCVYQTENPSDLKHKAPSPAQVYQCVMCDYKTNTKASFNSHRLRHDSSTEVCISRPEHELNYKTSRRSRRSRRGKLSIAPLHKCDVCSYEVKYKKDLKHHMLQHEIPPVGQMYRCHVCRFATEYKRGLKIHMAVHKIPSTVLDVKHHIPCYNLENKTLAAPMYIRNECVYQTKSDYPGAQPHKCEVCSYENKDMGKLLEHLLKHEGAWEVVTLCEMCDVETTHLCRQLRRDTCGVQINKCTLCDFKTSVILRQNEDVVHKQDVQL